MARYATPTDRYPPRPQRRPRAARKPMRINAAHLGAIGPSSAEASRAEQARRTWSVPKPPPGVLPEGTVPMAMDAATSTLFAWAGQAALWSSGYNFMGYPYLAELTQVPEYRRPSEILALEMTRKWIKLEASGEEDKSATLKQLEAALDRYQVRKLFRKMAQLDGFFGRGQIFVDVGDSNNAEEMKVPLAYSKEKIKKGGLKGFRAIEPTWSYPGYYNAMDPTQADWYTPREWYVMAKTINSTRLLDFVSRPMPDILKPAYSFGGLSLSQMGKPYVDNWLRTRQSVSDLLHTFSVMVLKTDMSSALNDGGTIDQIINRAEMFNRFRDNRGLMTVDMKTEDFANVAAPISGLHELQAQSQEHMAAVWGVPLVVLLGITPSGLNASSDGEMRAYYAWIEAMQEQFFDDNLEKVLQIVQLAEFGVVDPSIGFSWQPLWQLDEKSLAEKRKVEADTDDAYIAAGVLHPDEVRKRIANAPESPYAALDLNREMPEPPQDELEGEDPMGGGEDPGGAGPGAAMPSGGGGAMPPMRRAA